jgi:DNA-binding NarL/FixJ family response regulator
VATRVLIADDQVIVRAGYRILLEAEDDLEVVGEAGDGVAAVAEAQRLRPDVVLMDIRMPRLDGIEATRRLAGPDVAEPIPVLVVTTFDLDDYVFGALQAGASGFLLKDAEPEVLAAALRTVARGDALVAPSVTRRLIEEFSRLRRSGVDAGVLAELTEREREILLGLSRGFSNAGLARALYLSEATVKTHVSNLLSKLHLRSRVQAVILAYETGLVRPGDVGLGDLLGAEAE